MNAVNQWLKDPKREYDKGFELYKQYKHTNQYDAFFAQVNNPPLNSIHFKMLVKRMADINRKLLSGAIKVKEEKPVIKTIEVVEILHSKKTGRVIIDDNPHVDRKELPENLQVVYDENKGITKELFQLHAELKALGDSKANSIKAKVLANTICEKEDKRKANWAQIDTWWANKDKQPEPQQAETIGDIATRISNLENYIRRKKVAIKKNPKLKAKGEEQIKQWKEELDELRRKQSA